MYYARSIYSRKEGQEFDHCRSCYLLGTTCSSKEEKEKAIHHFERAVSIASPFNWHDELSRAHLFLARQFRDGDKFEDANTHIERAKSHAANNAHNLGCGMKMQARMWSQQCRLEDARAEALCALEIFERLGQQRMQGTAECSSKLSNEQWMGRISEANRIPTVSFLTTMLFLAPAIDCHI